MMRVHVVAPEGFDNPGQPTGGNIYDRRVCAGLAGALRPTRLHALDAGVQTVVAVSGGAAAAAGPG